MTERDMPLRGATGSAIGVQRLGAVLQDAGIKIDSTMAAPVLWLQRPGHHQD